MKTKRLLLAFSTLIVALVVASCSNQVKQEKKVKVQVEKNISKPAKTAHLKSSYVCYVNNQFMGSEQIPVAVDGKTYYGCCGGCVDKLKKNLGNVRYAKDPYTGKMVDKATAYIVLKPHANGAVLYFDSESNYKKYLR